MLLEFLQPYVVQKESRAIPKYHTYLKEQNVHLNKYYSRFWLQQGKTAPAVNMLRYILQFPDYEYLDSQTNNYDRYLNHLRGIHDDLLSIFDRSQRDGSYRKMFYLNGTTEEFILPVADVNTLVHLPLASSSWDDWYHVRPVRLWANDSLEYTTNILNDAVRYTKDLPSSAYVMIDIHALVFKYYIWSHTRKHEEVNQDMVREDPRTYFIHKYVICPCIWDLANSWLLNILNAMIDVPTIGEVHLLLNGVKPLCDIRYGYLPGNIYVGMEALWKVLHETKYSNLRPEALLSTKFMFNGSIIDRYNLSTNRLALTQLRRYQYHEILRDKPLFDLIVKIFKQRPELPTTRSLLNTAGRQYVRFFKTRPWNNCKRTDLRERVEQEMLDIGNLLEVDYY